MTLPRQLRSKQLVLALAISLWASTSFAAPTGITAGEMALLPEYCPYTRTFDGPARGGTPTQLAYAAKLGKAFWALHHYCWGLINARRATRAGISPPERLYLLQNAIDEIYYVIENNADPAFLLLPELYLRAGRYHLELGRFIQALDHFDLSRKANPDYWPAYLDLARLNARLGRRREALEALDAGLARIPNQPDLLQERQRLAATPDSRAARGMATTPANSDSKARRP